MTIRLVSFVGEGDDGIVTGGAKCGIDCSARGSHQSERGGGKKAMQGK